MTLTLEESGINLFSSKGEAVGQHKTSSADGSAKLQQII